ncbi:PD-(D/E)XK nuclease family protein [Holzapfeliella sp. He02]|uniref:PD-(D/E)XK nuclease family protein n=1 Tax=Holzapfeliella saturejae TaxID=3082953 RepID=A0ABU8SGI7_9LACO
MLDFRLGDQTDNIHQELLDEAVNHYYQHKQDLTFIIVPNHIKFDTEVSAMQKLSILEQKKHVSTKNLQILSFSRLSWFFLKDSQKGLLPILTDTAAKMILKQILNDNQATLNLFKTSRLTMGLIDSFYKQVLELEEAYIDPDDLQSMSEQLKLSYETSDKLHDLQIVYRAFHQKIKGHYLTQNQQQQFMNQWLAEEAEVLQNAAFYVSDFSHFSVQEKVLIKVLMTYAKQMTLGFKLGMQQDHLTLVESDYDYHVQKMIKELQAFALDNQLETKTTWAKTPLLSDAMRELNQFFVKNAQNEPVEKPKQDLSRHLALIEADSTFAETYFVARTIYREVALNNRRYRDFIVIAPSLEKYETQIRPIFDQLNIPFFNDLQVQMKYHPLVLLVEQLSLLVEKGLTVDSLLSFIKTRLIIPENYDNETQFTEDIASLENYLLETGINYNRLTQPFAFDEEDVHMTRLEHLRRYYSELIGQITKKLKQKQSVKQAITHFYDFLENYGVLKQLEQWRDQANAQNQLQLSLQPEQTLQTLVEMLEDYYRINEDESFDYEDFFEVLLTGFSSATFSQIPSTLDAVTVSELGMVQAPKYQVAFIIGADDTAIPQIANDDAFLAGDNINEIKSQFDESTLTLSVSGNYFEQELTLEDKKAYQLKTQPYLFGLAMTAATDQLYFSHAIIDGQNKAKQWSSYVRDIKNHFGIKPSRQRDLPTGETDDLLSFMTTPEFSVGYLGYLNQNSHQIVDQADFKQIKDQTLISADDTEKVAKTYQAKDYRNLPVQVEADLAKQLFGQRLKTSISQLESYYANPFEFFLKYGLKLKNPREFEFGVLEIGNYFHDIFDQFVRLMKADQLTTEQLFEDGNLFNQLFTQAVDTINQLKAFKPFSQNNYYRFLQQHLVETAQIVLQDYLELNQQTKFEPFASEVEFNLKPENFDPLQIKAEGVDIQVNGKIDRIDQTTDSTHPYIQVIDYKSSVHDFNLAQFYHGISLQLVTYLEVVLANQDRFKGQKVKPFGAFYQHISKGLLNVKDNLKTNYQFGDSHQKYLANKKYKGLLVQYGHTDITTDIEPDLMGNSVMYSNMRVKKDQTMSFSKEKSIKEADLKALLDYNKQLIQKAGKRILNGQFPLSPVKHNNQKTALSYSDYRDIFFFDAMLPDNRYRVIDSLDTKTLLENIKEGVLPEDD